MSVHAAVPERRGLMAVALGQAPADLVLRRARLLNVYTAELVDHTDVVVKGERIAFVGPDARFAIGQNTTVVDADGLTLVPGLIDGHTHVAASRYGVEEFIRYAAPGGTTTVITELIELASIVGFEGIVALLEALRDQPIAFFGTLPPLAALAPFMEDVAPPTDLYRELLARDEIVGLGEVYWGNLLRGDERLLELLAETERAGRMVEGHSAGARGSRLQAYIAAGVHSCHEPITAEEGLERLRLGLHWMARDGEIRRDLEAFAPLWREPGVDLRRLILVTDSVGPRRLLRDGYLDQTVRRAIGLGLDPIRAIQAATLNVAEHFRLDHLIGAVAPGRWADFLLVKDLADLRPLAVYSRGRRVARDGQVEVEPRAAAFSERIMASVQMPGPIEPADFRVPCRSGSSARVRVIEMVTHLVTRESEACLPVADGLVQADGSHGVAKVAAFNRASRAGERFVGFVRGFGLRAGALATTMTWDSQCLVVVGENERDMAVAANRVIGLQGGAVVCANGEVLAEFQAPIGGLLSPAPMPEIARSLDAVEARLRELGSRLDDPVLGADVLTTAAIPHLRITERGYVRVKDGQLVGLFLD